ncbi:hypothetical protein C2845_PM09G15300 [Panicum miliaceum]|uniref:Uncharacterized protein n=1 Tax=Panicum miliaceum TaxID=4540 RepID=A0A3L6S2B9_PANMI|nr:hypothetical protein C2845_PM09G15300 [Panicum miliaceum]
MAAPYPRVVVQPEVIPTPATIDKSSRRYSSTAQGPGEGGNPWEAKATRDNSPPQRQECWLKKLVEEESSDIPELMARIKALKDKSVTKESVAYSFIERRSNPSSNAATLVSSTKASATQHGWPRMCHPLRRSCAGLPACLKWGKLGAIHPEALQCEQPTGLGASPGSARREGSGRYCSGPAAPTMSGDVQAEVRCDCEHSNQSLGHLCKKSETPKPATSSTAEAGASTDSLPKEPVFATTAEPPIVEDVPAATEGKDLEPLAIPEVVPETEAPGTIPRPTIEEGTQTDQQAVASTPDQQEAQRLPGHNKNRRSRRTPGYQSVRRSREEKSPCQTPSCLRTRCWSRRGLAHARAEPPLHRVYQEYARIERALTDWKCDIYELIEEKEQLKKALEELQLKYSDLDDELTVTHQLKDAR